MIGGAMRLGSRSTPCPDPGSILTRAAATVLVVFAALMAPTAADAARDPDRDPAAPVSAVDALHAGDCNLCHQTPGVVAATQQDSCADCHAWVRSVAEHPAKRQAAMRVFPLWERYEESVGSYLAVPDLAAGLARLRPDWVAAYLADPYDTRPGMYETMPRFALTNAELGAITALVREKNAKVPATPAPDAARVAEGERLFKERACGTCHNFGGRAATPGLPAAPDLGHARDRMTADMLAAWIADPQSVSPGATMPATGLTADQALAVRDFLLLAELGWVEAPAAGPAPTAADAPAGVPVTWASVEARVFGRICVHCHMKPEMNQGRAGPGNAGGFGWPASGIELQTIEGVRAVADQIPATLLRRRDEAQRDRVAPGEHPASIVRPARPGMPLGLPPISDVDIALVLAWLEQGAPE
jgi:mono/diheme cytochrome c family protein